MKKIKVPKALQGIMPIMFIPVLSTLIVGLLMWYVIGVPIAWLMGIVTGWLTELGHVGQAAQADDSNVDLYTNVKQAKEFVERTNCDCLAVAIGTAHGAYPKGMIPKLDFERLKELKAELDMPLVLHGGSGAGEENL